MYDETSIPKEFIPHLRAIAEVIESQRPSLPDPDSGEPLAIQILLKLKNLDLLNPYGDGDEYQVVPYVHPRRGDIVEIVMEGFAPHTSLARWNGIRGQVVSTEGVQSRIRLLHGHTRPDGADYAPEFYWPTIDLKIIKAAER